MVVLGARGWQVSEVLTGAMVPGTEDSPSLRAAKARARKSIDERGLPRVRKAIRQIVKQYGEARP